MPKHFLGAIFLLISMTGYSTETGADSAPVAIAIHGGSGTIERGEFSEDAMGLDSWLSEGGVGD